MKDKIPFVWNATNTTKKMRAQLIDLFANYGARTRVVYIERPRDVHLSQNRSRKAVVPEDVIEKLAWRLDVPTLSECHDVAYEVTS
jgi:predicted kinase